MTTLGLAKCAEQYEQDGRAKANAIGDDGRRKRQHCAPPPDLLLKALHAASHAIQTSSVALGSGLSLASFRAQLADRQRVHPREVPHWGLLGRAGLGPRHEFRQLLDYPRQHLLRHLL